VNIDGQARTTASNIALPRRALRALRPSGRTPCCASLAAAFFGNASTLGASAALATKVTALDKVEAKHIAETELAKHRTLSYDELRRFLETEPTQHLSVEGHTGAAYQLEIEYHWDSGVNGPIRVMVSIDDGGWRAFKPLSLDFIKAPDGSFLGE
jgi:hypothetical protein